MESKITVVIPHRNRDANLVRCLDVLCFQTRLPTAVVVVDYDNPVASKRRKDFLTTMFGSRFNIRIARTGDANDFWLTRARNRGRREVQTPYMVSLDCDCLLSPPTLADAERWLDRNDVAMLGAPVLYHMEDGITFKPPWYGRFPSGGFHAFRVEDFDRIGGYNELMRGWGHEDRDFAERITPMLRSRRVAMLGYPFFHWYHPEETTPDVRMEQELRNQEIAHTSCWDGKEWRMK